MAIQLLTRNMRRAMSLRGFSSAPVVTEKTIDANKKETNTNVIGEQSPKLNAIFAQLKTLDNLDKNQEEVKSKKVLKVNGKKTENLATRIEDANTVEKLLKISEAKNVNRQDAMRIVSKLSVWSSSKTIQVNQFENDYRFMKLCRLLSHDASNKAVDDDLIWQGKQKSAEIEMILSVAGDDEAAKIIDALTQPQQVKVLTALAQKKARNITMLRSLAYNIGKSTNKLNLKNCSDILYAMTCLNFNDEILVTRIGMDVIRELAQNKDKPAVVGSIVTSLGYLKFKEPELLNNLTDWIIKHQEKCRPKDLASLFMTLALVNYPTAHVNELKSKTVPVISRRELSAAEWLDFVWALCVLEMQEPTHLDSILKSEFIQELLAERNTDLNPVIKMKLLNINAVASHLTRNYKGPFILPKGTVNNVTFAYSKNKKILVNGLLDTLKSLFNNQSYIRTAFDSKMGFIIDAECVLNENRIPLAVEQEHKDAFRIAFMILDFHDMCKGQLNEPNGITALAIKLLEKNGYHVLVIPHTEFSTSDKVLKRVQYLDAKLKSIVGTPK